MPSSDKINISEVDQSLWNSGVMLPRYSVAILDAIGQDRLYTVKGKNDEVEKYVLVNKGCKEVIESKSLTGSYYDGSNKIEFGYNEFNQGLFDKIQQSYENVIAIMQDEFAKNANIKKPLQIEELEKQIQEIINPGKSKKSKEKTAQETPEQVAIKEICNKYKDKLPTFGDEIGFTALSSYKLLLQLKDKKVELQRQVPDDLHANVANGLSDRHLMGLLDQLLTDLKNAKPKEGKKGFGHSLPQIKTICKHFGIKVPEGFTDQKIEEKEFNQLIDTFLEQNRAVIDTKKLEKPKEIKSKTANIYLSYVGQGRPDVVMQISKKDQPFFNLGGSNTTVSKNDTGLEGDGLFYNGSTSAVDCCPLIRFGGKVFTLTSQRGNAEGGALFGGIHSEKTDDLETAFNTMVKELLEETGNDKNEILSSSVKSLFKKISTQDGKGQNADPRKTNDASMSTTLFSQFIDLDDKDSMKRIYQLNEEEVKALEWLEKLAKGKEGAMQENDEMTNLQLTEIINQKGGPVKAVRKDGTELFAGHTQQIQESMPYFLYKIELYDLIKREMQNENSKITYHIKNYEIPIIDRPRGNVSLEYLLSNKKYAPKAMKYLETKGHC